MSNSKISIEISYDDLTRLIGIRDNDPGSLELRNSIVQLVASKYLKGILNDTLVSSLKTEIHNDMHVAINNAKTELLKDTLTYTETKDYWNRKQITAKLAKTSINEIKEIIEAQTKALLFEEVSKFIDKHESTILSRAESLIKSKIVDSARKIVNEELDTIFNIEVEKALKSKLNKLKE